MASSTAVAMALLVLMAVANSASASITCRTVASKLESCYKYVAGEEAGPNSACCGGVSFLKGAASSTLDRRAACRCLKVMAKSLDGQRAAALPHECGVSIPYPISTSVNCDSIV